MSHMIFLTLRTPKPAAALRALFAIIIITQISIAYACGGIGEKLCDLFLDGRMGCNAGLADVNGRCQTPRVCGAEGQRLCFVFIDGRGGCNSELVDVSGACMRPNCGGLNQHACAIVGRNSCDVGLVEVNNTCFRQGDCGRAGQRACLIGERNGNSCDTNLVERNGMCLSTPNCGALGQPACAVVGRKSCDVGLVEVNNTCFKQGDCGRAGQRACLIGERNGNSCDPNLVERNGMCVSTPKCGALGQPACAVVGRNSCDVGLVEFNHRCFKRGDCGRADQRPCLPDERNGTSCDNGLVEYNGLCVARGNCGAAGQRACLIGERNGNSCDANLFERGGKCFQCGALGQLACAIAGRNSCDDGLVEVNDICFTRGDCGGADQRACLIGERTGNSCDQNLFERGGTCYECGARGQRACAIAGRNSCDAGLVEVNDTCFTRGDCGRVDQRACLIGERTGKSCNANLVERSGICVSKAVVVPTAPKNFVFVRTEPPAPALRPGEPVAILATVYDTKTKTPIKSKKIEIFQATYFGPQSIIPRLIKTCNDVDTCQVNVPVDAARKLPKSISFKARITQIDGVFETPVRITDLNFNVSPMRMNVSAEVVGNKKVAELPHNRAIDIVFYAGTGYEFNSQNGAAVFSGRLKDELETMLGVSTRQPSSLDDNLAAVNFYVALAPATVSHIGLFGMCEHSTAGPVPFGDAHGILHPHLDCRDWSAPGPFYSAGTASISWHEMHHAAFGLSDEYCVGTLHHQNARFSNVYNSKQECERLSANASSCMRIADPAGCVDPNCQCSTSYWRSDQGVDDVMINNSVEQADDLRAVKGKFDDCRAGRC